MPTVLVTGAAGGVGRELVTLLSSRGLGVRAFDLPGCDFGAIAHLPRVDICPGDIADPLGVAEAAAGVAAIVHLAAVLPPASERDRDKTFLINVDGTKNVIAAARLAVPRLPVVFASSVSTYGDTSTESDPITPIHPQQAIDLYAESKIAAEAVVLASNIPYTILRIAGIAVPFVQEPPEIWPFQADQRIEFVSRGDVVRALAACIDNVSARQKIFNIAGGSTWRMRGADYVESQYRLLGIPAQDAKYFPTPGWFDWYDTAEAEATLGFQRTTYEQFLEQLRQAVEEEFA